MLILSLLMTFTACKQNQEAPDTQNTSASAESTSAETTLPNEPADVQQKPMSSVFVPSTVDNTKAEDGTVVFTYEHQNMSLTTQDPEVADKIIIDFLNRVDKTLGPAEDLSTQAISEYNGQENWIPYLYRISYEPTRIDQGVLSLFGDLAIYSGGPHPNRTNVSANYDLTNGDVLTLDGILQIGASVDAIKDLVLTELTNAEDKWQLFSDYETTVSERFSGDTSQDEDFYFTSSGLVFYFAPYEIAPYASGTVTVEIPYNKLTGILHDAYFPAETVPTNSMLTIVPFDQEKSNDFTQISEAVMDKEGKMFLLYTDSIVHNLRIVSAGSQTAPMEHTVFAAQYLTPGDAIMLQTNADDLQIVYENSNGTQTASLPTE